jgi:hypothetical protein
MQGYLFAAPTFETLPEIKWPGQPARTRAHKLDLAHPGLPSVA